MSVITKIEEQKNKKRVNIFVDDAFFCGLLKETAVVFGLKPGKEIKEDVLKEAVFESEVKSAFNKATDYLGLRMHTKKELFEKLLKKGYEKPVIEKAISKLEEYHYVDDGMFAKQFVSSNSRLSKRMIENKLREKGVSSNSIDEAFSSRSDDEEFELCFYHAQKYVSSKDMTKENAYQKLYASLARKGFSFENIKKACKKLNTDDDGFDSYDLNP